MKRHAQRAAIWKEIVEPRNEKALFACNYLKNGDIPESSHRSLQKRFRECFRQDTRYLHGKPIRITTEDPTLNSEL